MENKIYLQDVQIFLNKLDDNSADLIIADPPYNIKTDKGDIFKSEKHYGFFMHNGMDLAISKLKIGGSLYIFNNQFNSALTLTYLKDKLTFNNGITWFKKDGFHPTKTRYVNNQETCLFMSKGKPKTFNFDNIRIPYKSIARLTNGLGVKGKNGKYGIPNEKGKLCIDVGEFSSERHNKKENGKTVKLSHPTIKPGKIIERIIEASSKPNDLVLDIFSGSGQTTLISKKMNRNSLGCEINKTYYDKIIKALEGTR